MSLNSLQKEINEHLRTHQTYRLGIMGGTFDPIHNGHMYCAYKSYDMLKLNKVLFIPAGVPVYKKDKQVTEASLRIEMISAALKDEPNFEVSLMEINRPGDTYTIDTLEELKNTLPLGVELFFIVGPDAFLTLPKWKDSAKIFELSTIVLVGFRESIPQDVLENIDLSRVCILDIPKYNVSSTMVRKAVKENLDVKKLLPAPVLKIIKEQSLYKA